MPRLATRLVRLVAPQASIHLLLGAVGATRLTQTFFSLLFRRICPLLRFFGVWLRAFFGGLAWLCPFLGSVGAFACAWGWSFGCGVGWFALFRLFGETIDRIDECSQTKTQQ
jgi:hypothetical protein